MVIAEPSKFVAEVHDQMPVIPEAKYFEQWDHGDAKDAASLMKSAGESVASSLSTCAEGIFVTNIC
jgi:putative SOS response-associated peptidase YedK